MESIVKNVKHLIIKSIGKMIIDYPHFELLVSKVNHLVNRRPVAFKELLRNSGTEDDIPGTITPEMVVYGRELPSMNIIPQFHPDDSCDETLTTDTDHLREAFAKVRKANKKLVAVYHQEFLTQIITQATNKYYLSHTSN